MVMQDIKLELNNFIDKENVSISSQIYLKTENITVRNRNFE